MYNRHTIGGIFGIGAIIAAVAAAGGFATLRGGDGNVVPPQQNTVSTSHYDFSQPLRSRMVFYIVETDEQEAMVRQAEDELQSTLLENDVPVEPRSYAVYKVTTPEESAKADLTIGASEMELGQAGTTDVEVVDLRSQ